MTPEDRHRMAIAIAPKPKRIYRRGYQLPRTENRRRAAVAVGSIRRFVVVMSVLFPSKTP